MTLEEMEGQIINADCLPVLRELPDKCVDLVLTDPPYGVNIGKAFEKAGRNPKTHKGTLKWTAWKDKGWDKSIPPRAVFDEIFRVSKNQIIFGGNYLAEYLPNSPCWLVWDKMNTGEFADAELAYTSFKSPVRIYPFLWNGMLQQNMKKKEKRIHPTQKPVDLFGQIIRDYSEDGALILDPFSCSGTTALAARIMKRRFICIEKDVDYWRASVERLEEAKKQGELF